MFEQLGNRLRIYRKSKGFNQEEFSEYLDFSRPQISRYENGRSMPTMAFFHRIVEKDPLVNLRWFMNGRGEMYKPLEVEESKQPSNEAEILEFVEEDGIAYQVNNVKELHAKIIELKARIKDLEKTIQVQDKLIKQLEK